MDLSNSVISDDYFFILGLSALLSRELIDENYYIVDLETTNHLQASPCLFQDRKIFAFISSGLDYYTHCHLENVTFIHRRTPVKEVLSCLLVDNARFNYRVSHPLSGREKEVLLGMQNGLSTHEIGERLGMNMKTFYAHRTRLINKLQVENRIALYKSIARHRALA